jgi:HEAT repeat protein
VDPDTRIYAVWALGVIGDAEALPRLLALASNQDSGLRKTAVYALGAFASGESREVLAKALNDPVEDVRWNAALALARTGDVRAAPVLLQMMDRGHLSQVSDLTGPQREEAMLEAIKVAVNVPGPSLREALERLRDGDPSLKVREAARSALAAAGSQRP